MWLVLAKWYFFYLTDGNGSQNKYCMLEYYFDGPEMDFKIKPHGNAKSDTPFFRTAESARKLHREISKTTTPKEAVFKGTEQQGGEIEARGMSMLPRNRNQISYYRRVEHKKDHNVLYSVMLECKLAQGTEELFVRDVKAAPDPQCVLCFDWQVKDMERFLTQPEGFGILTVDTTYNLGQFYVTPTTYPHLMLEDVASNKHPTMLGPVLVHQRMDFATFNYFASTLVGLNKKLINLRAFGTDGQESMIEAFSHAFPHSMHLQCFIHFKRNIAEKLKELGIPSSVGDEILADIFGKRCGTVYEEGLVDAISSSDFSERLEGCKEAWEQREEPYAPSSGPRFYTYFSRYKASAVCSNMRKDLREEAGLGSPPTIFTTNASESINAVLKHKVNYKESEWPTFNESIRQLAKQQREVIRSLSGRGQYRLLPQFSHYGVLTSSWARMRSDQRSQAVKQFDNVSIANKNPQASTSHTPGPSAPSVAPCGSTSSKSKQLSISIEHCGITKLSLATLQGMWRKAESLLCTANAITPAPGSSVKARMVLSSSSEFPHLVQERSSGQYECDERCLNWSSSGICSHSIAVAEVNNDLDKFLQWYSSSTVEPNITSLGMSGLPSGRGRKGGIPKRKRTQSRFPPVESVKQRKATESHPVSSSPPVCTTSSTPNPAVFQLHLSNVVSPTTSAIGNVPLSSTSFSVATAIQQPVNVGLLSASQSRNTLSLTPSSPQAPGVNQSSLSAPNLNPFYVKMLGGNIRVCQGCRGSLRMRDHSIPAPPFDIVIARAERRQFRDSSGNLISPRTEQVVHYHMNFGCVKAVEPSFVPQSLKIPADISPKLTSVHKEYLRLVFQLSV